MSLTEDVTWAQPNRWIPIANPCKTLVKQYICCAPRRCQKTGSRETPETLRFLKNVGKLDRAIEQFRKTVQIDSRHVEARRQIILIFRDEGNFDAAIVEAKKWIKVKAISAMGHDMLADLLRERKQ